MSKKLSGGCYGEVSDFFTVILFLAVSAFIILTLKQNNELKALRRTEEPPITATDKTEIPTQKQKSVVAQKPDTDKHIRQLEKELEMTRIKVTLLEQKNEQLKKASSEKTENGLKNTTNGSPVGAKDKITAAELLLEKDLLLQEKEKQLNEKELTLEKKEKELMLKEEELKKNEKK